MSEIIRLRKIDRKRLDGLHERTINALSHENIWYIHTVLAQCFLPYRDPKVERWNRGMFGIRVIFSHSETRPAK